MSTFGVYYMARVEVAPDLIQIFEHAADALKIETYPSKIVDFKNGDVVHCSLLNGIYEVDCIELDHNRVLIKDIKTTEDINIFPIKPKYLKLLDKNSKAFKVLFSRYE